VLSTGTSSDLTGVSFVNASVGWVVSESGEIRKTTDGGVAWTNQPCVADWYGRQPPWGDSLFIDALTGWVAGDGGSIQKTTDGGNTWTKQQSGTTKSIVGLHFLDARRGWAVTEGFSGRWIRGTTHDGRWAKLDIRQNRDKGQRHLFHRRQERMVGRIQWCYGKDD